MRYPDRSTLCVSSQAGCGMACPFCATGQGGLTRNLSTGEILEQVRAAAAAMRDDHERTTVEHRLHGDGRTAGQLQPGTGRGQAHHRRRRRTGFGISARSVTVSTVGLAPAIRKLADERLGVTLALSLHAPDDELRDTLVPVNNRWNVAEVLDAAKYYADETGRRVSIEYALIRDVNDQPWRATCSASGCTARSGRSSTSTSSRSTRPRARVGCQPQACRARVRQAGPRTRCVLHRA